jgi:uncharacterized protein
LVTKVNTKREKSQSDEIRYRILCFDGGGIRGILTARILENIYSVVPDLIGNTKLFSGTSTGGIIALALANGRLPKDIGDMYRDRGKEIFDDSIFDNIIDLGKLIGADYSDKARKKVLKEFFGEKILGELSAKVAITAFDLDNGGFDDHGKPTTRTWKPKIFHNIPTRVSTFEPDDSDGRQLVRDVAMYTSAAPTYFPSSDGYIDGGVFANNPTMVAVAQALSARSIQTERAAMSQIRILSIGTGVSPKYIEGARLDWGTAQWAKPLISLLMDGVAGIADYQTSQLLGDQYRRIQVAFPAGESIETDSIDKISKLEQIAAQYCKSDQFQQDVNWVKQNWG